MKRIFFATLLLYLTGLPLASAAPVFEFKVSEHWDNNIYKTSVPANIVSDTITAATIAAANHERLGNGYLVLKGQYDGLFYSTKSDKNTSLFTVGVGWLGEFPGLTQYQVMARYRSFVYQGYVGSGSYGGSIDLYQQWDHFFFQERYELEQLDATDSTLSYTNNGMGVYGYWKLNSALTLGAGYYLGIGNINYTLLPSAFDSNYQGWSLFGTYAFSGEWSWSFGYDSQVSTINPFGTPANASRQIIYSGLSYKL